LSEQRKGRRAFTLWVPTELADRLDAEAHRRFRSRNGLIIKILMEYTRDLTPDSPGVTMGDNREDLDG
jgi:hypothetical protein